jgi:hypothetical protein
MVQLVLMLLGRQLARNRSMSIITDSMISTRMMARMTKQRRERNCPIGRKVVDWEFVAIFNTLLQVSN